MLIVVLIDGLNLIRRVYAAVPGEAGSAEHGEGVVQSITRSVARALGDTGATHGLCVMDAPGPGWRHALHPQYKAERAPMPQALQGLLPEIETAIAGLGVPSIRVPAVEADDVLASVALKVAAHPGATAIVLSTDKSMLTLLPHGVKVRNHFERSYLDADYVQRKYGVAPGQLTDWLALVGDAGQGIPGVRGIGAKSAAQLLTAYGSLEALLAPSSGPGAPGARNDGVTARQRAALSAGSEDARLSQALARLRTDIETGMNLRTCRLSQGDSGED